MEDIIKSKKAWDQNKDSMITEEALQELDDRYHQMLYEKEERQLEQESTLQAKQEETLRVQKTIDALEKKLLE